jgi:hypothetical protein
MLSTQDLSMPLASNIYSRLKTVRLFEQKTLRLFQTDVAIQVQSDNVSPHNVSPHRLHPLYSSPNYLFMCNKCAIGCIETRGIYLFLKDFSSSTGIRTVVGL